MANIGADVLQHSRYWQQRVPVHYYQWHASTARAFTTVEHTFAHLSADQLVVIACGRVVDETIASRRHLHGSEGHDTVRMRNVWKGGYWTIEAIRIIIICLRASLGNLPHLTNSYFSGLQFGVVFKTARRQAQ
jgi:hypothetical protein